jgi:hypothetical protein
MERTRRDFLKQVLKANAAHRQRLRHLQSQQPRVNPSPPNTVEGYPRGSLAVLSPANNRISDAVDQYNINQFEGSSTDLIESAARAYELEISSLMAGAGYQDPSDSLFLSCQSGVVVDSVASTEHTAIASLTPSNDPKAQEARLLMYYLDYVFPCQFRFYSPSAVEGGRGWLLYLTIQATTLYHAALALGAYHYRSILPTDSNYKCESISLAESQQVHLALALDGLQRYLDDGLVNTRHKTENVIVLGCIIQLISFEVCSLAIPSPS